MGWRISADSQQAPDEANQHRVNPYPETHCARNLFNRHSLMTGRAHYPYLLDGKTEAQSRYMTSPSQSKRYS